GKGPGLGLATVYGIGRQSGGNVWVYSEPGQGTSFRVYLPVATHEVEAPVAKPVPAVTPRGTETILLVEDEDAVRRFAVQVLERLGYVVIEASGGADALGLCELHPGVISLMITDVIMPRMSGPELARRLEAVRPAM